MKLDSITRASVGLLALSLACGASANDFRYNQCNMSSNNNADTMTFMVPLGDFYVPRDAPVGSVIGAPFQGKGVSDSGGLSVYCNREAWDNPNLANPEFVSQIIALARPYNGSLPPIGGRDVNGKVFHTSVQGVGIAMELTNPYFGPGTGDFTTPTRLAPLRGTNLVLGQPTGPGMSNFVALIALIKIGEIPPGVSTISPDTLFEGSMLPGVPKAFRVSASATIRQAQCSLSPTDPVSANPVPLGDDWSTEDFSGPGSHTRAVPFSINLQDCEGNPGEDKLGYSTAHVTLTGTGGSAIIDKDLGLFSLDTAASARGVGIQVLKGDGLTPVVLGEPFPITRVPATGNVQLEMSARLYQLPDGTPVSGGTTTGALNFTVNYL
jgi:type 1 fimbria pilin